MTQQNSKTTNSPTQSQILAILNRHEFSLLSEKDDGTRIAIRNYKFRGVICCDILVYNKIFGNSLQKATESLSQILANLQNQLQNNPHLLHSQFQSHSITFLRKKASVITNETRHPLSCRIIPVLLYQTEQSLPSIQDRVKAYPISLIHVEKFEQFIIQNFPKQKYTIRKSNNRFDSLRRSYRNLGISVLLLPLVLGLSGIFLSFELIPIAILTSLFGVLGVILILRQATNAFNQFKAQNSISIHSAKSEQTNDQIRIQTQLPCLLPHQFEDTQISSTATPLTCSIEGKTGED